MRTAFATTLFVVICYPTAVCAENPEYVVKRITQKIVIDGNIDEADWKAVPSFGDFKFPWWTEGEKKPPGAKLLWIRNTLALTEVECSAAYLNETRERDDLEILTDLRHLPLGLDGNLPDEHMKHSV